MKRMLRMSLVAFAAMLFVLGSAAMAQDQPGQGGPGGDQGGRRGMRFDPAQMQERMLDGIKSRLKASDEEWTAMKPLVSEVMKLQMSSRMRGMGGMFGRRRGGDNNTGDRGPRGGMFGAQMPEQEALAAAVENESTPAADLKAKMEAYRAAVKKQEEQLKAAREKLRAVLTPRQEAQLVLSGILD